MNSTLRNTLCVVVALGLGFAAHLEAAENEHQYGPTGIFGNHSKTEIKVTRVEKGSPADGKIKPGMQIIGAGSSNFKTHVRRELAEAIDVAETEEAGGKLTLILQGGQKIDITLEVLGTYSDTAPYNCRKCEAILKRARIGGTSKAKGKICEANLALMASQDAPESGNMPKAGDTYTAIEEDKNPGKLISIEEAMKASATGSEAE